jgi:hypothetical protein
MPASGDNSADSESKPFIFVNRPPWNAWFWPGICFAIPGYIFWQIARGTVEYEGPTLSFIGFWSIMAFHGLVLGAHMFAGRQRRITIDHFEQTVRFENFRLVHSRSRNPLVSIIMSHVNAIRPIREQIYDFQEVRHVRKIYHRSGLAHLHIDTLHGTIVVSKYGPKFRDLELLIYGVARELPAPPERAIWGFNRFLVPVLVGIVAVLFMFNELLGWILDSLDGLG